MHLVAAHMHLVATHMHLVAATLHYLRHPVLDPKTLVI